MVHILINLQAIQKEKAAGGLSQQKRRHLQTYSVWMERLKDFLEMELRIPVKPLVVVLLITLSGLIYSCIDAAGVSAEEMQKSSITVVESDNGGSGE